MPSSEKPLPYSAILENLMQGALERFRQLAPEEARELRRSISKARDEAIDNRDISEGLEARVKRVLKFLDDVIDGKA